MRAKQTMKKFDLIKLILPLKFMSLGSTMVTLRCEYTPLLRRSSLSSYHSTINLTPLSCFSSLPQQTIANLSDSLLCEPFGDRRFCRCVGWLDHPSSSFPLLFLLLLVKAGRLSGSLGSAPSALGQDLHASRGWLLYSTD